MARKATRHFDANSDYHNVVLKRNFESLFWGRGNSSSAC
jgi:hypothetical protein